MASAQKDFGENLPKKIAANEDKAKAIGAVFLFTVTGDGGGIWTVDLKNSPGVREGDDGSSECAIEVSAPDWELMSENPSSAMQLYFSGKLKVSGNMMLATKFQKILE